MKWMKNQVLWAKARVGAVEFLTILPIFGTVFAAMAIGFASIVSMGSREPGHEDMWDVLVGFVLFGLVYWQFIGSHERRKWGLWLTGSRTVLGAAGDVVLVLSGGEMRSINVATVDNVRIVSANTQGVQVGLQLKRGILDAQGFGYQVVRCQQEAGVDVLCDWRVSEGEAKQVLEAAGLELPLHSD